MTQGQDTVFYSNFYGQAKSKHTAYDFWETTTTAAYNLLVICQQVTMSKEKSRCFLRDY